MTQINIGIIGCGMVARQHIDILIKFPNIRIKWICDKDKSILNSIQKKYVNCITTNEYDNILKDTDINAVIICTPPNQHYKIAIDCIKAKKNVLLEKPISSNLKEAILLNKLVKSNPNLIVMECSARHSRFNNKFQFIKKFIQSKKLGKIYHISHNAIYRKSRPGIEYHPNAKWFYNKDIAGGGPIIDWGVYDISFHLGILNDVHNLISVSNSLLIKGLDNKTKNNNKFEVEEHGIVTLNFDQNLIYSWNRATNAHNESKNETKIYGTLGGLKFSYLTWDTNDIFYYSYKNNKLLEEKITLPDTNIKTALDDSIAIDKHFIACILGQETPILPFYLSVKHLEIIFEVYKHSNLFPN